MDEAKKTRKQIIFDINPQIHQQVKVWAARRNITINNWMQRAIMERLQKEERDEEKINVS